MVFFNQLFYIFRTKLMLSWVFLYWHMEEKNININEENKETMVRHVFVDNLLSVDFCQKQSSKHNFAGFGAYRKLTIVEYIICNPILASMHLQSH